MDKRGEITVNSRFEQFVDIEGIFSWESLPQGSGLWEEELADGIHGECDWLATM